MAGLPASARVVVIGGGIGGLSAAFHLGELGVRDVVLLDRAALSSGTTWHSTGNMETYRADPLLFDMVRYAAELYPRLAADSGHDIGWRTVGRVMYTDREERWEVMRTLPEFGRARGIDIELLDPAQTVARLPIIAADGLLGAIWVPSDARVNPTDAVTALARLARACGVVIREHTPVLGIDVQAGAVRAVVTPAGSIACDAVVLAAGLWSDDLARSCGVRLPLHALEHQYLMTKPFGIDRNLPLFLSYDDQLYGREEVGGVLFGSLDDHAIPVATSELPEDFASCLLNERWDQFEPYMATALRRFPVLRGTQVKMLLNGPESFTPDGQMLLGPVPGVSGLWAACGFNSNGMALAPAAGRYVAEWLATGAPSADVAALDVRRFVRAQAAEAYIRERVTEIPGYHSRMHAPGDDYATARNVRLSPLHAELAASGAHFVSVNAWERPLWFEHGASGSGWLAALSLEAAAGVAGVAVVDRSADAKWLIVGAGAAAWLAAAAPALHEGAEFTALIVPLPGARGRVEALARVLARGPDHCLLTVPPEQETRVGEWWRRANPPPQLRLVDQTAAHACLEFSGPQRSGLLHALTAGGNGAWVGAAAVSRHEDILNDSTVLTVGSDAVLYVWRRLQSLAAQIPWTAAGHHAEQALRIEGGVPAFGREITPATALAELLGGKPRSRRSRLLAAFEGVMTPVGFGPQEVLLDEAGRPVGELTSRARLPGWPATLALGLLDPDRWQGGPVSVVADGRIWPLTRRTTRWRAALQAAATAHWRELGV